MKKVLTIICSMLLVAGAYAFEVNEKVLKSFKQTFASAEDIKWEEYKTYYTVSFMHSGIRSKVDYNKNGEILGSIRYYSPEILPLHIFSSLKYDFPNMDFHGVTEVTAKNDVVYFVKIHDSKNWVTVKLDASGNSSIYEKYRKAK